MTASRGAAATRGAVVALALAFYAYYGVYKMVFVHFELVGNDFTRVCIAITNFFDGRDLYAIPAGINPNFYSPLGLTNFLPLCVVGVEPGRRAWFVLVHVLIVTAAWLLYCTLAVRGRQDAAVAVVATFGFSMPLYQLVISGNVNILVLAGLAVAVRGALADRPRRLPALLAWLTWTKIYPGIFVLPFVWAGRWREVLRYVAVVTGLGVVSVLVFGPGAHRRFLENLPALSRFVGLLHTTSVTAVAKLAVGDGHPAALTAATAALGLGLLAVSWLRSHRMGAADSSGARLAADLMLVVMVVLLVLPSAWLFYHAFLVVLESVVIFFWLQRWPLRWMSLFWVPAALTSFWEFVMYRVPVGDGLTLHLLTERREEYFVRYAVLASVPFFMTGLLFAWMLLNYDELRRGLADLERAPARVGA